MFSSTLLLVLLTATACLAQSSMTRLYNKRVTSAVRMDRPLGSSGGSMGYGLPHSGVVVTLVNGEGWLVHKGNDYAEGSSGCEAVVTAASHMSSAWRQEDSAGCNRRRRLGDYVKAAGCQYSLLLDNCWNASSRMMALCRR